MTMSNNRKISKAINLKTASGDTLKLYSLFKRSKYDFEHMRVSKKPSGSRGIPYCSNGKSLCGQCTCCTLLFTRNMITFDPDVQSKQMAWFLSTPSVLDIFVVKSIG